MSYLTSFVALVLIGFSWNRIFRQSYEFKAKAGYLVLTAVPLIGPIFYMLIDPPANLPINKSPHSLWSERTRGEKIWPAFDPIIQSLSSIFSRNKEK
jgi:hypothetical protein